MKRVAGVEVFQYKVPKSGITAKNPPKVRALKTVENLTGYIQGKEASDIEERFARALSQNSNIEGFTFRVAEIAGAWMPGEVEVDFAVIAGGEYFPVQVDGEYSHKSTDQKEHDALQDARLNAWLRGRAQLVKRIDGERLENQEEAAAVVAELFGG